MLPFTIPFLDGLRNASTHIICYISYYSAKAFKSYLFMHQNAKCYSCRPSGKTAFDATTVYPILSEGALGILHDMHFLKNATVRITEAKQKCKTYGGIIATVITVI